MADILDTLRSISPLTPLSAPTGGSGGALDFSSWTARQLRTGRPGVPGTDAPAPVPALPPMIENKQTELAATAEAKRTELTETPNPITGETMGPAYTPVDLGTLRDFTTTALSGQTGAGAATRTEMQNDMLGMRPDELRNKYGQLMGDRLFRGRMSGQRNLENIQFGQRNAAEAIADTIIDTGQMAIMGPANAAAAVLGIAGKAIGDNETGPMLAQGIGTINNYIDRNQSDVSQERSQLTADRTMLTSRDNDALVEGDTAERGVVGASVRQFGRNFADAINNTIQDPVALQQGLSGAVGSMLSAGPLASGIRAVGGALIPQATQQGARVAAAIDQATRTPSLVRGAVAVGDRAPGIAAVAAPEAGGAYTEAVQRVMEMSHENLLKTSDMYNQILSEGNPNDPAQQLAAKEAVANSTGARAAAIQAPIAAVAGSLVDKFEANPFSVSSLRRAGDNLIKEFAEEGIQGASGRTAQNFAVQSLADKNQSLMEGVGEESGVGALFGLGGAAVSQAPGAAGRIARNTVVGAGALTMRGASALASGAASAASSVGSAVADAAKPLTDRLVERGKAVMQRNEEAAMVPDKEVQQAAQNLDAAIPEAETVLRDAVVQAATTPTQQAQSTQYVDDLLNANKFDDAMLTDSSMPEEVRTALEGTANKVDAVQRLAQIVNNTDFQSPEGKYAGFELYALVKSMSDFIMRDPEGLNELAPDHPANVTLAQFENVLTSIEKTSTVARAIRTINEAANRTGSQIIPDEKQTILTAQIAPDKVNTDVARAVLQEVKVGKVKLTVAQFSALTGSIAVVEAARKQQAEREALGLTGKVDGVSGQVLTNTGVYAEKLSAAGHGTRIFNAVRAGNPRQATAYLEDFGKFVQSMQNKVAALNAHFEQTSDGYYQALRQADRVFVKAVKPMEVHPHSAGSIQFAQRVFLEAQAVADVYNGLVDSLPDLQVSRMEPVKLNSALIGKARDLANKFAKPQKAAPTQLVGKIGKVTPKIKPQVTEAIAEVVEETSVNKPAEVAVAEPKTETITETKPVVVSAKPRFTSEQITKFNDERLNAELDKLMDKPEYQTDPTFIALDEEMTNRETAEAARIAAEEEANKSDPETEISTDPMDQVFPNLIKNTQFKKAYKLPKIAKSNLTGDENPLATITAIMSEPESINPEYNSDIANAYSDYLENAKPLIKLMNAAIVPYLANKPKTGPNAGKSLGERFASGQTEANRLVGGKSLNIVELQADGSYKYNQPLIASAALAGLQWAITSDNLGAKIDEKDAAAILGIEVSQVTEDVVAMLDEGMGLAEAKLSVAQKIMSYWGLSANRNAPDGYVKGIVEAVAADLLDAMEAQGLVTTKTMKFDEFGNYLDPKTWNKEDKSQRQVVRVIPVPQSAESNLSVMPNAIDEAVLIEPEHAIYFGEDRPKVEDTQMRNPMVQNTEGAKAAIEAANNVTYKANVQMLNMYVNLGAQNFQELFGVGVLDEENTNINHYRTLEGKARTVREGFNTLVALKKQLENKARVAGGNIGDIEMHYPHNMSKVSRLQQLGKNTPQSNKAVREAILPTWSTLDLSKNTNEDFEMFMLAMGQHLDIKVHKQSLNRTVDASMVLLEGKLAPAVTMIQNWNATGVINDSDVVELKRIFKAAKVPLIPAAVHSLSEYGRYLQTNDKSSFSTSIYVEADGVTNGPINAMNLLTYGEFSADWVKTVAKGGLFFKQKGPKTMNEQHESFDNEDTYQATTNVLGDLLKGKFSEIDTGSTAGRKMAALKFLMGNFNNDLRIDEKGNLLMSRGIAKNPQTIIIYGSSAMGIAGKMVSTTMTNIYERLSAAQKAMKTDPTLTLARAMFSESAFNEDADEKFAKFQREFFELTGQSFDKVNPKTFTLNKAANKKFVDNMLEHFVNPMVEAITQTIGQPLMDASVLLRKSVQVQGIMLQFEFAKRVRAAVAAKIAADPTYKKDDFLSADEQMEILESLKDMSPLIQTKDQTFFIAGSQSSDVDTVNFSASMNDSYRTPGYVYGPKDPGVAGIPTLVIGMGDGMMMQKLSPQVINALLVFDGANFDLKNLKNYSKLANKAVYDSWQANPLGEVLKSFTPFMKSLDLKDMPQTQVDALKKALLNPKDRKGNVTTVQFQALIEEVFENLKTAAESVDARHAAVARVEVWVDQMASAGSPYKSNGTNKIDAVTDQDVADQLNVFYREELAKLRGKKVETPVAPSTLRVIPGNNLDDLISKLTLTRENKILLEQILQSKGVQESTVVIGSREEVLTYMNNNNIPFTNHIADGVRGLFVPSTNTVLVVDGSKETLLHELTHASTYKQVLEHYRGNSTPEVSAAIKRIEALGNQFLALPAVDDDMVLAQSVMNKELKDGEDAMSLNEYMAWTLTNKAMATLQAGKTATPLARVVTNTLIALKRLIFGNAKADDMFSELVFNTGIIARATVQTVNPNTTPLAHAAYGNDERITTVMENFKQKIEDYIKAPGKGNVRAVMDRQAIQKDAATNAVEIAINATSNGFNMLMQEMTAFLKITVALATQAQIDPNAMVRAQELYAHVTKNLSVENFMADPTDDTQRYMAQEQYNFIMGKYGVKIDKQGRSSLLPTFLALATVNTQFRDILATMPLPKTVLNKNDSLDNVLENFGNSLMDKLSETMSGPRKAKNVTEAIDSLQDRIIDMSQDAETFIDQLAKPTGNMIDGLNQRIIELADKASKATIKKADAVIANTNNTYVKLVANGARVVAMVSTEENGQQVALGVNEAMNKIRGFEPVRDLLGDLIGRTDTNAEVYDQIKAVKSVIQQNRQQFRENVPTIIDKKFSRRLSDKEYNTLHKLAKTDIAGLTASYSNAQILEMLGNKNLVSQNINSMENFLQGADSKNWPTIQRKSRQLANYMNTNQYGSNLLRNAYAISKLWNEKTAQRTTPSKAYVAAIDQLVTLYALQSMSQTDLTSLATLAKDEATGMDFVLAYLTGQYAEEHRKAANGPAKENHYKGFVPVEQQLGASLVLANSKEGAALLERSYVKVGGYTGSNAERFSNVLSYYYAPVSGKPPVQQGILQNVHRTASGVNEHTGYSEHLTAGRITDPVEIARVMRYLNREQNQTTEHLSPVYDDKGAVVALERTVNPDMLQRIVTEQHLGKTLGSWRGRQVEENTAQEFNNKLIDSLHALYMSETKDGTQKMDQFVDLNDPQTLKDDPVLADMLKLMNYETKEYVQGKFGNEFWVSRDMLKNAFGYRNASVGDMWTGVSRWSPENQERMKQLLMGFGGNNAYKMLVNGETVLQNFVKDARVLIVVKSMIVPMGNFASNIFQMVSRGIPIMDIMRNMPRKTAEVNAYTKSRLREIKADAELRAAIGSKDTVKQQKLRTEMQSIKDSYKRMSIWPLIEAGEFSSVSDAGISREEILLSEGRLHAFMEQAVSKLPQGMQTAGRYALITKDTALFQGLQKAVEYGDFLAKAITYDDLTKRQKKSKEYALSRVTEEFVNYDVLSGRFRGYLEGIGMLWFYNFKLRSTKIAVSMIRNNPLHALIGSMAPSPSVLGVGTPIEDNVVSKLLDGSMWRSWGIGQGLHAPMLNPWMQIIR